MLTIIKKLFLILMLSTSLYSMEELKSITQLKEHKLIFLVFERNGCPWCARYKNILESGIIDIYSSDIKFYKVKKGSSVFSDFRKKLGYEIIMYPKTYLLQLDKDKNSKIIHEIYGYQTQEYIEELFKDIGL